MIEKTLIVILAVLVVALSASILIRRRRTRGTIPLHAAAVGELVTSIVNNIKAGKIQDIAGKVSFILSKHLGCEKIIFLKYYKSFLELNYYNGLQKFNREDWKLKLAPALTGKLKSFHRIAPVSELQSVLSQEYLKRLGQYELSYFFPVYLRENLYGIYFIKSTLPPDNPSLQFLSTALAFNLSTAYHIGIQEQQIKKYEDRVKQLVESREKAVAARSAVGNNELLKYLKISNSKQLVPELVNILRKECDFSKMSFCVQTNSSDETIIAVNWNVDEEAGQIIKDGYEQIASGIETDRIFNLDELSPRSPAIDSKLRQLQGNDMKYLAAIPWIDNKKAILAWAGDKMVDDIASRLKRFKSEVLPLVENVNRYEKVEELSYTDGLTGIYNLRYFRKRISEEFMRAKRYGRDLALLIFDIDDLKNINDRYGHLAGDSLLKSFGRILDESVRSNDVISRYGGDEFCMIMPETSREKAQQFMERIREKIAVSPDPIEGLPQKQKYSVSIGGAVFPVDADSIDGLINAADMALLKAKSEGRNRSRLYLPEYDLSEK
jgi:diguanylate cyclase (GGDEF)-like protein